MAGTHDERGGDCAFCAIIASEAPATIIREWHDAIAFVPLGPVVPGGHILVVPRRHVADAVEDPTVTAATMARAAELAAEHEASNIITSIGRAATQSIFHLHIHVIRRAVGDQLMVPWGTTGDPQAPHSCKRSAGAEKQLAVATARAEKAEEEVARLNDDSSGWSDEEDAEFEKRYGVEAAMRLLAANNRVWAIVRGLRAMSVEAGLDPYRDPMAQRLSAALICGESAPDSKPRPAKSSMLMGVFLRVSGLTLAEAGRLFGVSANAVNAWIVGARMNAEHFARLDDLNGRAQRVESTTFYHRRASIMTPRNGQPSIYQQWLTEARTLPIDPPGEPAYSESAPTETEKL